MMNVSPKVISLSDLRPIPVKRLSDPTAAIPVLRVSGLTESEAKRKPVVLKEVKIIAN
jgi:hypothetical protein